MTVKRWLFAPVLFLPVFTPEARAQVYGYTDERGVLVLSNVPTDPRMRVVANPGLETAPRPWRYNGEYDEHVLWAAQQVGIDSALITAVIAVESAFNRFAVSNKGAMGLMQLMPGTARDLGVANVYDPRQNIRGGSQYLRNLLDEFGDLKLALAAYNAGPEVVRRLRRVPPYTETTNYLKKVLSLYQGTSRIQIARGAKVYTIGPNGQARLQPETTVIAGKSSITLLRRASKATSAPPVAAPAPAPAPALASSETGEDAAYYRYRDTSGVVYITRERPSSGDFEVLR